MGCTAIQSNTLGLEHLVSRLQAGGATALGTDWEAWFSGALHQLEMDNSIDPHAADRMAEALAEAEEALLEGACADAPLQRLVNLFMQARVETRWRRVACELSITQLRSTLWDDLVKALDAAAHAPELVEAWLDHSETELLRSWEGYEQGDVLANEVTIESILGHEFLSSGLEEWLQALAELRDGLSLGRVDRAAILARAEAGQRLLVTVQAIEDERRSLRQNFIAAWMN